MNIWIIDHYSSEPKYNGYSRQYNFAKELGKRGYNVLVVSSSFSHFTHSYISNEECFFTEINKNAHYAYVKTLEYHNNSGLKRILNTFSFVFSVGKNYKKMIKKYGIPDVVVGCSVHPFTWIIAHHIAKKYNAHFLVEARDLWPETQINDEGMSPYHPIAILLKILQKWAFDRAEKIISSIPKIDKYVCDVLGYSKEKVVWISQPIDCEEFDRNKVRYKELDLEIKNFIADSFLCVFTGYYKDYEGVYEMLGAAKIIKNHNLPIKFVFVGNGSEEDKMRKYADENKLDNVFIGKRIKKELVPALLEKADICLAHLAIRGNPNSYKYGSSKNKVSEYMYSNSCIIYGSYMKEQVVNISGAGYVIDPFNANEFAEKIIKVFEMDEKMRKRFGENGRKFVLENSTVEKLIDKYEKLFY